MALSLHCFETISACDGHTDGHTTAAYIALQQRSAVWWLYTEAADACQLRRCKYAEVSATSAPNHRQARLSSEVDDPSSRSRGLSLAVGGGARR